MDKCTQLLPFVQALFDDPVIARKATAIVAGVIQSRSPRLSDIAREMSGNEAASYKAIQSSKILVKIPGQQQFLF